MYIRFLFELSVVILVCVGIYHENKFIEFEHKLMKYIKVFFKALYLTVKEKIREVTK